MDQGNDYRLIQTEIHDEMKTSYIDYAMSVIVGRALPDVRDGLKPVHRRILYGMSELNLTPDKAFKKCARIVGDVMGKYHPHGDSSVYDALVRLAQDFSTRYMLVDGHGNFGNIDGDGAAAMRYTEARMTSYALLMLKDIEKNTVDFAPNFDGDESEPIVLPSRFPNLLVNGSNGIAVGMATSIPPHNMGEVIDATTAMIDNPEITGEELCKIVKGPDFPTGAIMLGKRGARDAYLTGRGTVTVRSKSIIEETKKGKIRIIFTEIPYQVNKGRLLEKIGELIKDKRIEGISALRDESDRHGIRIVLELKRDVNPQIVINRLYKQTQLQDNYSMINIALVNGEPKVLTLQQMLFHYLEHQKEVVTRRTQFELDKAQARAHILEGLIIALDNIDEVIKIIRESYNDAKQRLMDRFSLSEIQSQAILDMRLARLQGLERERLEAEFAELMKKIEYYLSILNNENLLLNVIRTELIEVKDKYADKRRTEISATIEEIEEEDLINEEQVAITITNLGYVKRVPADTYRTQKRGGRGITGVTTRDNDFVKNIIITSSHNSLMFFTNQGKVHKIKAYEIPEATRTAKGTPAINFLNLAQKERITAVLPIAEFREEEYLISVTRKGTIKKTSLTQFENIRKNGLIAIKLTDGDELIGIKQSSGTNVVIVVTREGKSICFHETDVRPMGRNAMGVRAINLEDTDEVVSMELAEMDEQLLVVTKNGYGKRTPVTEYAVHKRGGKGMLTYDKSKFDKTGELIGATTITDDDEIILINSDGIVIRIDPHDIKPQSRSTMGVKIMRVEEEAEIIALSKVEAIGEDEDTEDATNGETATDVAADVTVSVATDAATDTENKE
ncbi:MAG: DNA gyrase subunit A [Clostridiales Family XIII bacterium]|jgi:DNA gyrase subunit A|nr:DNA gyrase subunit A [Clostridiales Family XIII bacterium]